MKGRITSYLTRKIDGEGKEHEKVTRWGTVKIRDGCFNKHLLYCIASISIWQSEMCRFDRKASH